MKDCRWRVRLAAVVLLAATWFTSVNAQQGVRRFDCTGFVSGVSSQALLEITPGGFYTEGPGVAGWIRNKFVEYSFSGTLFGRIEGFVTLVERRTGVRIDRVWIGLGTSGFALRTEDGAMYGFQCQE